MRSGRDKPGNFNVISDAVKCRASGSKEYREVTVGAFGYLWRLYQDRCVGGDTDKEASGLVLLGTCLSGPEQCGKGLDVRDSKEGEGTVPAEFRGQRSAPG